MESKEEKLIDIYTAISYAQLSVHALQNSGNKITPKELEKEMLMWHKDFTIDEIKQMANIIVRRKK